MSLTRSDLEFEQGNSGTLRGRKDAEFIRTLLVSGPKVDAPVHTYLFFELEDPLDVEAHDALTVFLDLPFINTNNLVQGNDYYEEVLSSDKTRVMRQICVQHAGVSVNYITSPVTQAA
jgi:hypothetical protein